ncbi:DUF2235 domain-containing protein [Ancylobacter sp.]|uniref:DUF2235 domain-containing protein n=1 Tax=Ancylobacter sp. TaxID=1872567 RepID=UPI003C79BFB6
MSTEPASQAKPAPATTRRRLILCLDGTWNTADSEEITNIVRLRDMLQPGVTEGVEQRIYYDEGVGTLGGLDKYVGGGMGRGLDVNVRQAYRFLAQFYERGDEIYIFGFSRGAFTARSLAGYIGAAGLLLRDNCTRENEEATWLHYRTDTKDRYPKDGLRLAELCHRELRIRVLGVFDTVGALGIPLDAADWLTGRRRQYQFHDTTLSSIIDHSLHALAIDEMRRFFPPSLWQVPQHANYTTVEQVWFPGVHSDIGGGYGEGGVGAVTLDWMLTRIDQLNANAGQASLTFRPGHRTAPSGSAPVAIHESRHGLRSMRSNWKPSLRVIAQQRPPDTGYTLAALPPHAKPLGEYVHLSALERLTVGKNAKGKAYRPRNLAFALEQFFAPAHVALDHPTVDLGFMGGHGPLDWLNDPAAFATLQSALPPDHRPALATARANWAPPPPPPP